MRSRHSLLPLLLWGFGACSSAPEIDPYDPPSFEELSAPTPFQGAPSAPAQVTSASGANPEDLSRGAYLSGLDSLLRSWQQHYWSKASNRNESRVRYLRETLYYRSLLRIDDLILELESSSPRNRRIAAAALGFTEAPESQGPLLGALFDRDTDVVLNALLSLGQLKRADTPTAEISGLLTSHPDEGVRSNAAFALLQIAEAGGQGEDMLFACRQGLLDAAPTVRVQCSGVLGYLGDSVSCTQLGDLLLDDTPMAASAAARALRLIGDSSPPDKGACARLLAESLDSVPGAYRDVLLFELRHLSDRNYGEDAEPWIEWARKMP